MIDAGTQECRPDGDATDAEPTLEALVHDINNVTGRLLSTLYLCLSEVEPDHPAHSRLQAANSTSLELRSLIRRLETTLSE